MSSANHPSSLFKLQHSHSLLKNSFRELARGEGGASAFKSLVPLQWPALLRHTSLKNWKKTDARGCLFRRSKMTTMPNAPRPHSLLHTAMHMLFQKNITLSHVSCFPYYKARGTNTGEKGIHKEDVDTERERGLYGVQFGSLNR